MERHFEKDLNELKERPALDGQPRERAVHQSVHAVLDTDEQLAKRVSTKRRITSSRWNRRSCRSASRAAPAHGHRSPLRPGRFPHQQRSRAHRRSGWSTSPRVRSRVLRHPRVSLTSIFAHERAHRRDGPQRPQRRRPPRRRARASVSPPTIRWTTTATRFSVNCYTYMMGDSSVVFPAFELILVAKTSSASATTLPISPKTSSTSSRPGYPTQHVGPPSSAVRCGRLYAVVAAIGHRWRRAKFQTGYSMTPTNIAFRKSSSRPAPSGRSLHRAFHPLILLLEEGSLSPSSIHQRRSCKFAGDILKVKLDRIPSARRRGVIHPAGHRGIAAGHPFRQL